MSKFFTDPLIRRFFSGAIFAGAFVWLAIYFFDVETEVIRVLAIMSGLLILLIIGLAFAFSFVMKYLRRSNGGMLENIDLIETKVQSERARTMIDATDTGQTEKQRSTT